MSTRSIAINRFGLGAGSSSTPDPKRALLEEFDRYDPRPASIAAEQSSSTVIRSLSDYHDRARILRQQNRGRSADGSVFEPVTANSSADALPASEAGRDLAAERARVAGDFRQSYAAAVAARTEAAVLSETPFVERLVHFWSNHFAVSADKLDLIGLAGSFEFEAIRPHVLGRFADMLAAVERHAAMLVYLDQASSAGPNSPIGLLGKRRGRRVGLNENLAREIMELHTLGARSGYAQADVTEFARALTGWTVGGLVRGRGGGTGKAVPTGHFVFVNEMHEPGERIVLSNHYADAGLGQATAILANLSVQPATAVHLATKLARHFGGDVPPPAMIDRLKTAFLRSGGDLPTIYRAIVESPEAWAEAPLKFKSPWEWSLSVYRALGPASLGVMPAVGLLNQLGQPVWKPGQPAGYDDTAASWAAPDALMRRVEAAERLAAHTPAINAPALAARLFPDAISSATAQALDRAESSGQALALLLVSPEMMRR